MVAKSCETVFYYSVIYTENYKLSIKYIDNCGFIVDKKYPLKYEVNINHISFQKFLNYNYRQWKTPTKVEIFHS